MSLGARWLRFNAVGIAGAGVQLGALYLLRDFGVLAAMALAVELAVLHNFAWHEVWTWGTRGTPGVWARLARFHVANGLLSIASNLVWMHVLTHWLSVALVPANLIAIVATSLLNFALGERFVFRRG